MEERDFFDEKPEQRTHTMTCPHCGQPGEYQIGWLVRRKKAQVPRGAAPDAFNPDEWMEPKEQRKVDDFIVFALAAAGQALRDADWAPKTYEEQVDTGVLIGSGIGGLGGIYEAAACTQKDCPSKGQGRS